MAEEQIISPEVKFTTVEKTHMLETLSIAYEDESLLSKAEALASRLSLPINNSSPQQLRLTPDKLVLSIQPFLPLYADFNSDTWKKRHEAGKKQGLVRACKPRPGLVIWDVTAGWGRDAAVLASFGAKVLMLERNPIMAELLKDALDRQDADSKAALDLSLIRQDALAYLQALPEDHYPDLIYIDPMHPIRDKAALVKKDLQVLQQLVGVERPEDSLALLQLARLRVKEKVVVKWPQRKPALMQASSSVHGKTVRFDLYLGSKESK